MARLFKCNAKRVLIFFLASLWLLSACGPIALTEEQHLQRGLEFREQGDLRSSAIELQNLLQKNPASMEGRFHLGLTYLEMQRGADAENELLRARELGMDHAELSVSLARARLLQARFDEALSDLERTPMADESLGLAHLVRGWALLGTKEARGAKVSFEKALEQMPDQPEVMVGLARASHRLGDLEAASEWTERALSLNPSAADALQMQGELALAAGDHERAEAAFSEAIPHAQDPYEVHFRRALVRVDRGDLEGALKDLQALQRLGPAQPGTKFVRGVLHSRHGRHREAQTEFQSVLSLSPNHAPALYSLGVADYALGNLGQAEHSLRRHLREQPDSVIGALLLAQVLVEQDRIDAAAQVLNQTAQASPTPSPELIGAISALHWQQGRRDLGIGTLRAALQQQPDDAGLHEFLGMALMRTGDREAGLAALGQSSALESSPRRADLALILTHLQAQDYPEALAAARRLRDKQPDNADPHVFMGMALVGLQRTDEARNAFRDALERDPESILANMNLGGLEMGLGRLDAARQAFEAVQRTQRGNVLSATRLAALEVRAGQPEKAVHWLEQAIEVNPDAPEPSIMLAQLMQQTGEASTARAVLEDALAHNPEGERLYFALSELLQTQGRPGDAVRVMRRAESRLPQSAELQYQLARALEGAGDKEGMFSSLGKAVELDAENVQARTLLALALAQKGELEDARQHLQFLETHESARPEVLALSGWFALRDGELEQGVSRYRAALEQRMHRPWIMELAQAQRTLGNLEAAQGTLNRWLQTAPQDPAARHALASLQMVSGVEVEAIANYRRLVEQNPQDAMALNNLAWLLRETDPEEALRLVHRARTEAPDSILILSTLGVVLRHAGDLENSEAVLRELVARDPSRPASRYHLALTLKAQGDGDGAREALKQALESSITFPERDAAETLLRQWAR